MHLQSASTIHTWNSIWIMCQQPTGTEITKVYNATQIQHRHTTYIRNQELRTGNGVPCTEYFVLYFYISFWHSCVCFYFLLYDWSSIYFERDTWVTIQKRNANTNSQTHSKRPLWASVKHFTYALCTDVIFFSAHFFLHSHSFLRILWFSYFVFLSGTFFSRMHSASWLICQWNQQTFTAKWIYIRIVEWKKNEIHASTNYRMHKIPLLIDSSYAIQIIIIRLRILLWSRFEVEKKISFSMFQWT